MAQSGNRPSPLVFKIHGPIKNMYVQRDSDGAQLAFTGEISSGNYMEIDTSARTVKLNGITNALGLINSQATNWSAFVAPPSPRTSTFSLHGSSATAAFMEVLSRSAYA